MISDAPPLDDPARIIEARVRASGTSFYSAMRLLRRPRREAMYAIYAFCRAVDDIADEPALLEEKRRGLDAWRREIADLYAGGAGRDVIARALALPITRFALRQGDFEAVIDGMAMDAEADIVAPDRATLDLYCDRVASAVGRLSVRAFGCDRPEADRVAYHQGRALQLTNILRDVAEDAARGRLYLPRELLDRHGVPIGAPAAMIAHPMLPSVLAELAGLARHHFAEARLAIALCPRAPMRPARLMLATYQAVLDHLEARGWTRFADPATLSKPSKIWLALRHGLL